MEGSSIDTPRFARILSFDAGGVRCLSSLKLLEAILQEVHEQGKTAKVPKPCEYFDLIGGSEWGGVLALMLGRLRMSIEQCFQWFASQDLSEPLTRYFYLTPLSAYHERRRMEAFKSAFANLLGISPLENLCDETLLFDQAANESTCKTAILVGDKLTGSTLRLRSYKSKMGVGDSLRTCTILQAAVASVTMPLESEPVRLRGMQLISASVNGYSNPSKELLDEATYIWDISDLKAVVSLGSGERALRSPKNSVGLMDFIQSMTYTVTDTERVVQEMYRDSRILNFDYFRLNVPQSLDHIHRLNWSISERVQDHTGQYLSRIDTQGKIETCAESLLNTPEFITSPSFSRSQVAMEMLSKPPTSDSPGMRSPKRNETAFPRTRHPVPPASEYRGSQIAHTLFSTSVEETSKERNERADMWIMEYQTVVTTLLSEENLENVSRIKVAVLDTGIDPSHPFIQEKWMRPETDDNNDPLEDRGYFDFVSESSDPTTPEDTCGHGTHVAGLILQLAPFVKLYVARVFQDGVLDEKAAKRVAEAIRYAADKWEVNAISMSFGFHAYSHDIYSALDYASKRGIVMLAAASNDGRQAENPIAYPAGELGMVICINAANPWGGVSVFNPPRATNRDNFTILGENVKSAWPGRIMKKEVFEDGKGTWKRASGTSVATPIAAALTASLMQFGRMRQRLIRPHYRKLESYGGIRQIFAKMTLDKNRFLPPDGFDNIVPGLLLRTQYWDPKDLISTKISEELMKY